MRARKAEIGEHAVAHELGDEPVEARDRAGRGVLIAPQQCPEMLGIDGARKCGRADHIGKQRGDLSAFGLSGRFGRRRRSGAGADERRDRLQEPAAVAQRHAEPFEILLGQFGQDVETDIIRLESIDILLETKVAQPVAKSAHVKGPDAAPAIESGQSVAGQLVSM